MKDPTRGVRTPLMKDPTRGARTPLIKDPTRGARTFALEKTVYTSQNYAYISRPQKVDSLAL